MKTLLSALLLSIAAAGAAHAATVSFSDSHGPDITDWDPAEMLALQKFDPSLGTLHSVTFQFDGSMATAFTATGTSKKGRDVTNVLAGTLDFQLPTLATFGLTLGATDTYRLEKGVTHSQTLTDSDTLTETLRSDLEAFIGMDQFDLGVLARVTSQTTAPGNGKSSFETMAFAQAQVTYDYSPLLQQPAATPALAQQNVPEPGSLVLVGLGLAAAGLSRRRKA